MNRHGEDSVSISSLQVLVNAIEANKRFAQKYRNASNRNELMLEFAEAVVIASRILMRSVQGEENPKHPNARLFCECLEMNRKGLLDEFGGKLSSDEGIKICDRVTAFACAVFANQCGYSEPQKESLLQNHNTAYFDNLGREDSDAPKRLLEATGQTPTPKGVVEIAICLAKKPWIITEPDDFVKCWKLLPPLIDA